MISIIVSTHNSNFLKALVTSLEETIGVEYELISIENQSQFSICNAYNQGVARAKYDYICFVHEDVIFISSNWGVEAISVMEKNADIGLIGVVGTKYKTSLPLGWYHGAPSLKIYKRGCIYQGQNSFQYNFDDFDLTDNKLHVENVVCLDGVFLFTRREILNKCRFDEELLTDFHGYDIDFSLQVLFSGRRVVVDREIRIFHYSLGVFGKENAKALWGISRKWIYRLPVAAPDLNLPRYRIFLYEMDNFKYYFLPALKRTAMKVTKQFSPRKR